MAAAVISSIENLSLNSCVQTLKYMYTTNFNAEYQAEYIDKIPTNTWTLSKYEDYPKGSQLIQRTLAKQVISNSFFIFHDHFIFR